MRRACRAQPVFGLIIFESTSGARVLSRIGADGAAVRAELHACARARAVAAESRWSVGQDWQETTRQVFSAAARVTENRALKSHWASVSRVVAARGSGDAAERAAVAESRGLGLGTEKCARGRLCGRRLRCTGQRIYAGARAAAAESSGARIGHTEVCGLLVVLSQIATARGR